jgi:Spy/CpxP family protein refolding chaperone
MKKIILISFAVAIATVNGFAQEKKGERKTPEQRTEKIVVKLNEKLALTDDQKTKVKEVILKQEQQREVSRKQFENNRDAFKESNKKNMQATDVALKNILTPDQMEKVKQLREEQKEKRENKKMHHPEQESVKGQAPQPK